jgi:lipopolysaccharide export system protein LptA
MRKFLPIIVTFLVITGGFLLCIKFQPRIPFIGTPAVATQPSVSTTVNKSQEVFVSPGQGVWITQYDRETGKRTYQFKADFYDNRPDGTVRVTRPMIEFFLSDGQIVHIEADDGVLRVAPGADRNAITGVPVEPPRYGTLNTNVIVKIYASEAQQEQGNASVTLTTSHVEFDNDTFRLFTQDYVDADGNTVRADYVPVAIRAKQYSFDGSGLVMYWDDMSRRLKSLDIAHGKQLVIYDSSEFNLSQGGTAVSEIEDPDRSSPNPFPPPKYRGREIEAPAVILAADVKPADAGEPPAPVAPRQRYLATFYNNVIVSQNNLPLIKAALMQVDFLPRGGSGAADTVASASPPPPPAPSTPAAPVTQPSAPPAQPSDNSSGQPIVITWDGKMHMVPTDESTAEPLDAGQSIVTFTGSPVRLHHTSPQDGNESDALCTKLVYRTIDSSARLTGDEQNPLLIWQKREDGTVSTISGNSLLYSRLNQIAVIEGAGKAHLPDPNEANTAIDASWDKNCIVHLTGPPGGSPQISSADLSGQVTVDHPKFNLTADDLSLTFDAPAAGGATQQLKGVRATGNAQCVVHESDQTARSLAGEELQLFTARDPDGKLYPKTIQADGAAQATEGQDNLAAEHIVISLLPKVSPTQNVIGQEQNGSEGDVQLDELNANDTVRVQSTSGASATGNNLKIVMVNGHAVVTLRGDPAVAKDKDSTLVAKLIHLSANDQMSSVDGAGELDTVAGESPSAGAAPDVKTLPTHPIKITWSQSATMDGKSNQIHVLGDVNALSTAADGTVNTAHGSELIATLIPSADAHVVESEKQSDFGFMQNKQLQSVSLRKKASIESTLRDAGGAILRRYYIRSTQIDYDTIARRLSVPEPGQMLVEDHTKAQTDQGAEPGVGAGGRGRTAFEWSQGMMYDEMARTADLQGDVKISHWDDGAKPKHTFLSADVVHVEFQPMEQSDEGEQPASDTPQLEISHLMALHHVEVDTASGPMHCGEADYDPIKQLLICRAGDEGAVSMVDGQGNVQATFKEVRVNLLNNTMQPK